jgi:hypothetical protein
MSSLIAAHLEPLIGYGLAAFAAGCLLRLFAGNGADRGPKVVVGELEEDVRPRTAVRSPADDRSVPAYHVFIPGVGSGERIDDVEQPLLDRRWARAGSPTLGARWEPPAADVC